MQVDWERGCQSTSKTDMQPGSQAVGRELRTRQEVTEEVGRPWRADSRRRGGQRYRGGSRGGPPSPAPRIATQPHPPGREAPPPGLPAPALPEDPWLEAGAPDPPLLSAVGGGALYPASPSSSETPEAEAQRRRRPPVLGLPSWRSPIVGFQVKLSLQ